MPWLGGHPVSLPRLGWLALHRVPRPDRGRYDEHGKGAVNFQRTRFCRAHGRQAMTTPVPLFTSRFGRLSLLAPSALRLAVGVVIVAHGLRKPQAGPTETWGGFFASLGLPAPVATAWLVTLTEFVGGILSRIVGLVFAAVMAGAIPSVSINLSLTSGPGGPSADLNVALLAGALALALIGPGRLSLDHVFGLDA